MIARIPLTAKVPVFIDEQPEGGYTVTSPLFPEFLTEGDTIEEVLRNIQEAFGMIIEDYVEEERPLPRGLFAEDPAVSLEPAATTSWETAGKLESRRVSTSMKMLNEDIDFYPEFALALSHAGLSRPMSESVALLADRVHFYASEKIEIYPRRCHSDGHLYISMRYKDWERVFPAWQSKGSQAGGVVRNVVRNAKRIGVIVTRRGQGCLWYRCDYRRIDEICRAVSVEPPVWSPEGIGH